MGESVPDLRDLDFGLLLGNGMVVEQDVSVKLNPFLVIVVWYILFHKFLEPLCLQGACTKFLVLRIKVHKAIRVSHAFLGPASSGKEGLKNKRFLSY